MDGVDTYTINGLDADGFLSVVLSGPDDYRLEILSSDDLVLRTVDRGGAGIEEASQYEFGVGPGTLKLRVTVQACGPHDLTDDCQVAGNDVTVMFSAWGFNPGHPADYDGDDYVGMLDFFTLFEAWGGSYQLEVLSRDNLFPTPPQAANRPAFG